MKIRLSLAFILTVTIGIVLCAEPSCENRALARHLHSKQGMLQLSQCSLAIRSGRALYTNEEGATYVVDQSFVFVKDQLNKDVWGVSFSSPKECPLGPSDLKSEYWFERKLFLNGQRKIEFLSLAPSRSGKWLRLSLGRFLPDSGQFEKNIDCSLFFIGGAYE